MFGPKTRSCVKCGSIVVCKKMKVVLVEYRGMRKTLLKEYYCSVCAPKYDSRLTVDLGCVDYFRNRVPCSEKGTLFIPQEPRGE